MDTIGLIIAFVGALLMLPESCRLTRKNKEGVLSWESGFPCARFTPYLFVIGVIFLAIGFIIQLVSTL